MLLGGTNEKNGWLSFRALLQLRELEGLANKQTDKQTQNNHLFKYVTTEGGQYLKPPKYSEFL